MVCCIHFLYWTRLDLLKEGAQVLIIARTCSMLRCGEAPLHPEQLRWLGWPICRWLCRWRMHHCSCQRACSSWCAWFTPQVSLRFPQASRFWSAGALKQIHQSETQHVGRIIMWTLAHQTEHGRRSAHHCHVFMAVLWRHPQQAYQCLSTTWAWGWWLHIDPRHRRWPRWSDTEIRAAGRFALVSPLLSAACAVSDCQACNPDEVHISAHLTVHVLFLCREEARGQEMDAQVVAGLAAQSTTVCLPWAVLIVSSCLLATSLHCLPLKSRLWCLNSWPWLLQCACSMLTKWVLGQLLMTSRCHKAADWWCRYAHLPYAFKPS